MSKKVLNTLKWWKRYSSTDIKIKSSTKEFCISLRTNSIAHLLGLQYAYESKNLKGIQLFNYIIKNKISDENIYSLVKQNNPNQLENVKQRVENFKCFMENLENASVVEMTSEITKIKSDYLIIKDKENRYLQLGIKNIGYEDVFETFLISSDNIYFKDTTINEKIISIQKYNDNFELEPFSFKDDIRKIEEINLNKYNKFDNSIYGVENLDTKYDIYINIDDEELIR